MTTDPHAGLSDLARLTEQYMERMPLCLVCHDQPAVAPMVFMGEPKGAGGRRRCAAFAVCMVCMCQDDFEHRLQEALMMAHAEEAARWN
jgi:hypothetical protein